MTYFVGIDIAKYKHDCFIVDEAGQVIRDSFSFSNDKEGMTKLLSIFNLLIPKGKIKIGFEATGHYGMNLKFFLEANGFDFMEFNPLLVSKFISTTTLRRTKTDKKDSYHISRYLMTVDYKPYVVKFYHIYGLKSLTRLRNNLIKERSKYLVCITNVLDYIFPEFKAVFSNGLNTKTSIYILSNYKTIESISNMTLASYNAMASKLKHTISFQKFQQIKLLAKNTIGNSNKTLEFELQSLISLYKNIASEIDNIENQIEAIMMQYDFKTPTIRGIGIQSAASIIAEVGDFSKFTSPHQLLAFAGLEPSCNQSGLSDNNGKMVKHGSSYLRYTIMNCAETYYVFNPVISEFYWRKRNDGKSHRVALSHVARKLINVIFLLETKKINFDSSLVK